MKISLLDGMIDKIRMSILEFESQYPYAIDTVMYMNDYTRQLFEIIMIKEFSLHATPERIGYHLGDICTYQGTNIIIKNDLDSFEIEIAKKEN